LLATPNVAHDELISRCGVDILDAATKCFIDGAVVCVNDRDCKEEVHNNVTGAIEYVGQEICHHFKQSMCNPKDSPMGTAKLLSQEGNAGDEFGCSVTVDGDTVLDDDNGEDSGSACIFSASDAQLHKLKAHSVEASSIPGDVPNVAPSKAPSLSPSSVPSEGPSLAPAGHRSVGASSRSPSSSPASGPTRGPTSGPKGDPIVSFSPSYLPSGPSIWPIVGSSGDKFKELPENKIKKAHEDPVSTFSADTDTASYSFARRQLKYEYLPPPESIKVEEFINYFDYDYPKPEDQRTPFEASVAIDDSPWHEGRKLLHIGIKGYDVDPVNAPPANVVFLVDVSGSMAGPDRLDLAKESMKMLVKSLQPNDNVSIVTYARSIKIPLLPTLASKQNAITSAIDNLIAGGGTWGAGGLKVAYEMAERNFNKEAVNRIILLTDGDFNIGTTDEGSLEEYIQKKRETGIFLSVLGFGMGNYHDTTMKALANHGNGVAAYIDNLNEAYKVMVSEASSTIFPIAKDVKIQVEFNPATVSEYQLIGYEKRILKREDFNDDKVDAGEIGSGHTVTAIYEITPVGSTKGDGGPAHPSEDKNSQYNEEYAFLKIRSKLPDEDESKVVLSRPITKKDEVVSLENEALLKEFRFATAVASFAQNLRAKGEEAVLSYEKILELAQSSVGEDKFGYRKEFITLVMNAKTALMDTYGYQARVS